MYKDGSSFKKIYSACGYIDLRCGVDGLAATVQQVFQLDPCDEETIFLFCGRRPDLIKTLVWKGDGFLLLYKRLADGRFRWPKSGEEMKQITAEQYSDLLSGFTIESTIRKSDAKYAV